MSVNLVTKGTLSYPLAENVNQSDDRAIDLALKIRVVSKFDSSIEINRSVWAVTMVTEKGKFHVRLVFEGVGEKLGAFFRIAHLQGPKTWKEPKAIFNCFFGWSKEGRVALGEEIEHAKLRLEGYGRTTETWARPREKIELMIELIENEALAQNEGRIIPFSFFGRRSLLTKEIDYFEVDHPELRELQKSNPKRFAYLVDLNEKNELIEKFPNVAAEIASRDSNFLSLLALLCSLYAFRSMGSGFALFLKKDFFKGYIKWIASPLYTLPLFMLLNLRLEFFKQSVNREKQQLALVSKHVCKVTKIPNSCYTWAEEKLLSIDVKMPQGFIDRYIAISTLYVNRELKKELSLGTTKNRPTKELLIKLWHSIFLRRRP